MAAQVPAQRPDVLTVLTLCFNCLFSKVNLFIFETSAFTFRFV